MEPLKDLTFKNFLETMIERKKSDSKYFSLEQMSCSLGWSKSLIYDVLRERRRIPIGKMEELFHYLGLSEKEWIEGALLYIDSQMKGNELSRISQNISFLRNPALIEYSK